MAGDYYSFDDVMRELKLDEEELKRMVSEGELRAFRDANTMKFKKEDIEGMRRAKITEPTVILPLDAVELPSSLEETGKDTGIGSKMTVPTPPTRPTEAGPTTTLPPIEELDFGATEEESVIDQLDAGVDTETKLPVVKEMPPFGAKEDISTAELTRTLEKSIPVETPAPIGPKVTRITKRQVVEIPAEIEEQIEARRAHWAWSIPIFLAFAIVAYGAFFLFDMMRQQPGQKDKPTSSLKGTAEWFLVKYHYGNEKEGIPGDPNWRKWMLSKFEFPNDEIPYYAKKPILDEPTDIESNTALQAELDKVRELIAKPKPSSEAPK